MAASTSTFPTLSRVEPAHSVIRPPDFRAAAFTTAAAGDLRAGDRTVVADVLGISAAWTTVNQVHGDRVVEVSEPGVASDADALFTTITQLPLAVFGADCALILVEAATAVGVAHAGWRGTRAGVAAALVSAMCDAGHHPQRAAIGPTIGTCCYEVGPEVLAEFGCFASTTDRNTPSIDLVAANLHQLGDLDTWAGGACTKCGGDFYSYRADRTSDRMAGVAWLP